MSNSTEQLKEFKGFLKLNCQIIVKTGLHIGGSKESIEIGGIDNIVVKTPFYTIDKNEYQDVPYIPGSSIKGKLRSLLEWVEKPAESKESKPIALSFNGEPCRCGRCKVCKLFGAHKAKSIYEPVRLRIDDFFPTKETLEMWERILGNVYTEIKTENVINRIKGTAEHPRHMERVIPGSVFEGTITVRIFEGDDCRDFLNFLKKGFEMLMDDYLGGNGSRGYGRVEVKVIELSWKPIKSLEDNKNKDDCSDLEEIFS